MTPADFAALQSSAAMVAFFPTLLAVLLAFSPSGNLLPAPPFTRHSRLITLSAKCQVPKGTCLLSQMF